VRTALAVDGPGWIGAIEKNPNGASMSSLIAQELERIGNASPVAFEVTFSDGQIYRNRDEAPAFSIRFRNRAAEWGIVAFGHIGMCDAYFDGGLDIDGDLGAAFRAGMASGYDTPNMLVEQRNRWHELWHANGSYERAKENARAHYGLGDAFYRLWLDDPLMMYTCAYWRNGEDTLESAQVNKIEHVCRKLQLREGERLIDIGCGFGGFMFHVAPRYGVHITGTNTTTEQVATVRDGIRQKAMEAQLRVVEADFREPQGQFDKVVSIGVLEHAGRDQLDEVVKAHADCLKPGGLGMLHFIGHVSPRDTELFIREHVFPGGWIPALADVIVAMEEHGLEVLDIENLRRHYAKTLDAWSERFDERWPQIQALDPQRFNERFRRIWRVYLIGCAEMFRSPHQKTHLFQIVFSKGNVSADGYPMTRDFLYTNGETRG